MNSEDYNTKHYTVKVKGLKLNYKKCHHQQFLPKTLSSNF